MYFILHNLDYLYIFYFIISVSLIFIKKLKYKSIVFEKYFILNFIITIIFWGLLNIIYYPLEILFFLINIIIVILVFSYSKKNLIIFGKNDQNITEITELLSNDNIDYKYNRNVYEIVLIIPEYDIKIFLKSFFIKYMEIETDRVLREEQEYLLNKIKVIL
ncbi:MAG TPA: hypothetical protein VKN74_05605 [Candidatus Mcinerneyibacterium sp.]|nr:hypothetical protein [Candidatus Mcinerneyibacterium sp.]